MRSGERTAEAPIGGIGRRPWRNWAGDVRCTPELTFEPGSVEDLVAIVRFAVGTGRKLRVVGSGHSWSALVPTDDIMVKVERLDRVYVEGVRTEHPRVVVESGATVKQVNDVLERAGLALPFNVVLESVRFGGLISTGSHGSGWHQQTLSDLVHSIDVVTASGEVRCFERGLDPDRTMRAVCLSLGTFGVIWRVTLDVLPTFCVHAVDRLVPLAEALERLGEWVPSHDNCDLFWWPFTEQAWVKTWDRTEAPATQKPRASRVEAARSRVEGHVYDGTLSLAHRIPRLTPVLSKAAFRSTPSRGDKVVDIVEAIHYRRSIEITAMGCVEVAFKIDNEDFSGVRFAIEEVVDAVRRWAAVGRYPMNVTLNVRFIHNSDCLLSPASGHGHTCYIEILSRTRQRDWYEFSAEVASAWLTLPRARPHWAKEHRHLPGIVEHVRAAYGAELVEFRRVRSELGVDPEDTFVNGAVGELLFERVR